MVWIKKLREISHIKFCLIKYLLKACKASTWTNIYLHNSLFTIYRKMEAFDGFVTVNLIKRSSKIKPHPFILFIMNSARSRFLYFSIYFIIPKPFLDSKIFKLFAFKWFMLGFKLFIKNNFLSFVLFSWVFWHQRKLLPG